MGRGEVNLNYNNEGFHAGLGFSVNYESGVSGNISGSAGYDGDIFSVNAGMDILNSGIDVGGFYIPQIAVFTSLWGKWFLFEKQLEILVAYKGPETIYWRVSDMLSDNDWDNLDGGAGLELNFTPSFLEGLSVGFMFPVMGWGGSATFKNTFTPFVVGAKYEQDIFAIGLMYTNNVGHSFGKAILLAGKVNIGDTMNAGAEVALGHFEAANDMTLNAAVCFNYFTDRFGVGGTVKFGTVFVSGGTSTLNIAPYVQYAFIEETLLARLDLEVPFTFASSTTVGLKFTPAVYYNPDASGISDDPAHALFLKAALGWTDLSATFDVKTLTIGYRWAF